MMASDVMAKREAEALLAAMDPSIRKERDAIVELLVAGEKADVLNKWEIGVHVGRMKLNKKHGLHAVQQVAATLPETPASTLDSYHRLAAAWPKKAMIEAVIKKPRANGKPIGLTHLLAVASLDSPKQQEKLIKKIVADSMTKNDVIAYVQNLHGGKTSNRVAGKAPAKTARPVSTRAGLQQMRAVMKTIQEREALFEDSIFKPLTDSAPADWSTELLTELEEAQAEVTSAEGSLLILKKSLAAALKRGEKVLSLRKRAAKGDASGEDEPDDDDDDEEEDDDADDGEEADDDSEIDAEADAQDADDDDDELAELPPRPAKMKAKAREAGHGKKSNKKKKRRLQHA